MRRQLVGTLAAGVGLALSALPGQALDEAIGQALFRRAWVPAPASTKANAGLGPLFNARACTSCHQDLVRSRVEVDEHGVVLGDHLVLRFSDSLGRPDLIYGRQLQTSSVPGTEPEGHPVRHHGRYEATDLRYGALAPETRSGARLAPALRGLGLLESIPDDVIAAQAEQPARGRDGVVGRVHWITDAQGRHRVGRFGWKASLATLSEQVENAFLLDLGLSTPGHPSSAGDCTAIQTDCLSAPHGGRDGSPEIGFDVVSRVTAYLATIPPDEPEEIDASGRAIFASTGCAACHRPSLPGATGPVPAFTDLLLHEMGTDLDGGATEPGVAPTEWRTAPLWGLSRAIAQKAGLLHDGRAATVEEAVRLHGGEAARSRTRFEALTKAERQRLVAFLTAL